MIRDYQATSFMAHPLLQTPRDEALLQRFRRDVLAASMNLMKPDDRVGVAVSGGSDSLALLLLSVAAFPGRVVAMSVDHQLRPDSAAECAFVADTCAELDIPHLTLPTIVKAKREGVQAAARRARYLALGNNCQWYRVPWMLTGHHRDDQAETVLMRLARGSGVGGLSGIDAYGPLPWRPHAVPDGEEPIMLSVLRPLLGWSRAELAAIVAAAGLTPVADPSNADLRFDRTRFRALLGATDLLEPPRLAATARHCADADDALGWAVVMLEERWLDKVPGRAVLEIAPLKPWHVEIMRRVLLDIFRHFHIWPLPRGPQIVRLLDLLHAGRTATLAGIKAVPRDGTWTFTPAPPRRPTGPATRQERSG